MSALEKHYSVKEIAKLWHMSMSSVRALFFDEPGIIKYGHPAIMARGRAPRKKQHYTLSIPESVMVRVYERRLQKKKPSVFGGLSETA